MKSIQHVLVPVHDDVAIDVSVDLSLKKLKKQQEKLDREIVLMIKSMLINFDSNHHVSQVVSDLFKFVKTDTGKKTVKLLLSKHHQTGLLEQLFPNSIDNQSIDSELPNPEPIDPPVQPGSPSSFVVSPITTALRKTSTMQKNSLPFSVLPPSKKAKKGPG
ncbi:hypothetical protein GEMRC1_006570 [Eukaryota sp. GEM-RC1]